MPGLLPDVDPEGLLEYSVVFTDRSLNHMSQSFQGVMRDISASLRSVYSAHEVAVVPGGGTFAMEAVARQFAHDKKCMVIRNGFFSFRWSQIFEAGNIPAETEVLMARPISEAVDAAFAPAPLAEVIEAIERFKPDLVFAPHVETASGILLPDDYVRAVGAAVHEYGGMFVLDCIASGALWVDMVALEVDVLISAPQKGWSASPCAGLVMLNETAAERLEQTTSSSFAADLKKWRSIMAAYEGGGHAYHATMPTDALTRFRSTMLETIQHGLENMREAQIELGGSVRDLLSSRGFASVAAPGFEAPGVVVSYTNDPAIHNGSKFVGAGLQIAAGVPLMCDEPETYQTFRLGLFGLDKLNNREQTVTNLRSALDQVG
jgi:aspartate aminotransferase-like enzyme